LAWRSNPKNVNEVFAEPFRRYLKTTGWEDGRNIRFLFVWAEGDSERAPALASELVAQSVDLIITFGDPAIRGVHQSLHAQRSSGARLGGDAEYCERPASLASISLRRRVP